MKPVMQTKVGKDGNCMSACIASLLEVPIESVDRAEWSDDWLRELDALLDPFGYTYAEFNPQQVFSWCGECLMIGCGQSPRGLMHAVIIRHRVGRKGYHTYEWVHDPHPEGGWVKEVESIGLLLPKWGARRVVRMIGNWVGGVLLMAGPSQPGRCERMGSDEREVRKRDGGNSD